MLNPVLFPLHGGVSATCSFSFYPPTNYKSAFTGMVSLAVALNWKKDFFAQAVAFTFKNPCSFASIHASNLIYHALPCICQTASTMWCGGTTISLSAASACPSSMTFSIKLPYVPMAPYILHIQIHPRGLLLLLLVIHCSFFSFFSHVFLVVLMLVWKSILGKGSLEKHRKHTSAS